MDRIVKINYDIPESYERVIMEEYYKFICDLYGYRKRNNVTYTRNQEKWSRQDKKDEALNNCVDILLPRAGIYFASLYYDDILKAMARFRILSSTHIADIVFPSYPNLMEKEEYVKFLIEGISNWMNTQKEDVFPLSVEVPKCDDKLLSIMTSCGFLASDEVDRNYPTSILERKRVLTNDGSTHNCKKA